ncbi:MAG: glycosyltransferase family 4 protein [Thermodesulfobacteriota bacterium]|nr:glycosyltransferase family 4 protein [Thermodesulfobacteriota bacterium]
MVEHKIILYLISLLSGAAGAWACARFGTFAGFVDYPSRRSSHVKPTPKGGGIGVLVAFIISSIILECHICFWLPVVFVAILGLMDDRKGISPFVRLCLQTGAAFVMVLAVFSMGSGSFNFCYIIFWVIFITGTANCYNFMDGINGIAGLTASALFFLCWLFLRSSGSDTLLSVLVLSLLFACLGFLPFNFPGAKVFMGDCGSLMIGFLFGGIVLISVNSINDFFLYIAFLFPFYADAVTTMVIRIKKRENLFKAHRSHLYQILVNEAGFSHFVVALLYFVVQMITGIGVLYFYQQHAYRVFLPVGLSFAGFAFFSGMVRYRVAKWQV